MLKLSPNLLLFSDLDGSLLDHHSYRWDAAQPWLDRLARHQVPLIIATSKTAAEVGLLQQQLKLTHLPFIAENGAQIVFPADWQETDKVFGADYATLRATLAELRASRQFTFEGFADVDDATVAAWTGLPLADAQRARQRAGSEPLRWLGNDAQLTVFNSQLAQHGLTLTQGGRFYHVMGENVSKGHAARWLTEYYQRRRQQPVTTLCLGDGPNDIPLLSTADYAVAIRGQQDTAIDFPSDFAGQLYRTHQTGPQGWSEGLDHFLEKQP
ncbi:mannosyl-3-phosphoglycerate phosphatase [Gibbsiella quercinecans]|uniref:mannosyl-3-phosphoglycerate phosphatase-related protein n=1 Tax=Gibbsiella quercinecans TaxID=929813 RepID=UPI000EF2064C|nr:mannosyl-3-phosphoglycerate phosphatase [Gibbsiella quercinecans]